MYHTAVCRTPDCENEDYEIVLHKPGQTIFCGPCGQQITDITPPLPEEPYHDPPPGTIPVDE